MDDNQNDLPQLDDVPPQKRQPQRRHKPRVPPSEKKTPLDNIMIHRPEVNFRVLKAFQKQGLFFIDMETGTYVDGLMPLPSLGLSFVPPTKKKTWKSSLGFLNLGDNKKDDTSLEVDSVELDAVLFFEYKGPECITGALEELEDGDIVYLFFLTIWNDYEFNHWHDILEKVVADLTVVKKGIPIPLVKFTVTTTFVPNNPTEPNRLVIEFGGDDEPESAVSDQRVTPVEDDCEDYHKFKPRF